MDNLQLHLFLGHKESLFMVELEQKLYFVHRNCELYTHNPQIIWLARFKFK